MIKTVLYIATSLDGFIARPDGRIDWLTSVPDPRTGDYGYAALLESIGTVIMGRKTYEEIIGFDVDWPYIGLDTYILTNNYELKILYPDIQILTGSVKEFITALKELAKKDIWLVGGGQVVTQFLNDEILDKMIITIIPKIIGEGIPLFAKTPKESKWKLIETKSFDTGVVNLTYEKTR
ncbi:MAG TPA: dihydrofolate reductase family protein [Saprospiraceae bacterium]|nr:dihydrofolate reductase family protein [Saprospiraceae bacterium]